MNLMQNLKYFASFQSNDGSGKQPERTSEKILPTWNVDTRQCTNAEYCKLFFQRCPLLETFFSKEEDVVNKTFNWILERDLNKTLFGKLLFGKIEININKL